MLSKTVNTQIYTKKNINNVTKSSHYIQYMWEMLYLLLNSFGIIQYIMLLYIDKYICKNSLTNSRYDDDDNYWII